MERSEAYAEADKRISELRKVAHQDEYVKLGIEAWENGNESLALAIFEDANYHQIAEAIFDARGRRR